MKVNYRGFEIDVTKSMCLGGWRQTYLSVFRTSDGYELICDHTEDTSPVRHWVKWMKNRVDGFIKDPSNEILPDEFPDEEEFDKEIKQHRRENAKTELLHGRKHGKGNKVPQ